MNEQFKTTCQGCDLLRVEFRFDGISTDRYAIWMRCPIDGQISWLWHIDDLTSNPALNANILKAISIGTFGNDHPMAQQFRDRVPPSPCRVTDAQMQLVHDTAQNMIDTYRSAGLPVTVFAGECVRLAELTLDILLFRADRAQESE